MLFLATEKRIRPQGFANSSHLDSMTQRRMDTSAYPSTEPFSILTARALSLAELAAAENLNSSSCSTEVVFLCRT
jgi:hypothetical protein